MGRIRAIVTYKLVGDIEAARDVMRRAAAYTDGRFGDRMVFDPFVNEETGKVIWVNSAADTDTLIDWEQAMGEETGFRAEAMSLLEFLSMDVLDPVTDPRLVQLREVSTMMQSMLD